MINDPLSYALRNVPRYTSYPTAPHFHDGVTAETLLSPVTLGIALGLFFGKQIGVMGITWLGTTLKIIKLPRETTWAQYYGMALLTGIGFTMSLFIGNLAFATDDYTAPIRIGVLGGSLLAGLLGYLILMASTKSKTND